MVGPHSVVLRHARCGHGANFLGPRPRDRGFTAAQCENAHIQQIFRWTPNKSRSDFWLWGGRPFRDEARSIGAAKSAATLTGCSRVLTRWGDLQLLHGALSLPGIFASCCESHVKSRGYRARRRLSGVGQRELLMLDLSVKGVLRLISCELSVLANGQVSSSTRNFAACGVTV
jgi:hypothetical protein